MPRPQQFQPQKQRPVTAETSRRRSLAPRIRHPTGRQTVLSPHDPFLNVADPHLHAPPTARQGLLYPPFYRLNHPAAPCACNPCGFSLQASASTLLRRPNPGRPYRSLRRKIESPHTNGSMFRRQPNTHQPSSLPCGQLSSQHVQLIKVGTLLTVTTFILTKFVFIILANSARAQRFPAPSHGTNDKRNSQ